MRTVKMIIAILIVAAIIMPPQVMADRFMTEKFEAKDVVRVKTLSADVIVKKGSGDEIILEIENNYYPEKAFKLRTRDSGRTLKLTEKIYGDCDGSATWTLTVPQNTEIDFNSTSGGLFVADIDADISGNTASGDYEIRNCSGRYDLNTASGDYDFIQCNGRFDINTASGDHNIEKCEGQFDINTASGNIDAEEIVLSKRSKFNSASGDVEVALGKSAEYDLSVNSASGDATLDYDGNDVKGYFEFQVRYRRGDIESPFDFDDEERIREHGQTYMLKSFTRGDSDPDIRISSATGDATLKK
ncbi:MAG: DUF4097 domain-containing protein [candidate division Zixibacteria bacterium]|nr:DUF4097 domain-containing protein [candidate division Zixibacteria bacterium]